MGQSNLDDMRKVLIVDDEDLTRLLLSQVLEKINIRRSSILTAEDGEEAVRVALDERPDLILLDLLLPKINGYDVCRSIREIPGYNPYIIILTARGQNTDRQQSRDLGANEFMTKPFNPSRLMSQLDRLWNG